MRDQPTLNSSKKDQNFFIEMFLFIRIKNFMKQSFSQFQISLTPPDHLRISSKFGLIRSRLKNKVIAFVFTKSTSAISILFLTFMH